MVSSRTRSVPLDDPDRFLSPAHTLAQEMAGPVGEVPQENPYDVLLDALGIPHGIAFDLIRPDDLVALTVIATGCDLVRTGSGTSQRVVLRPHEKGESLLVVSHPFQHILEEARREQTAPQPDGAGRAPGDPAYDPTTVPGGPKIVSDPVTGEVQFRPARGSRVVFDLDRDVEFSREGVLDVMQRLRMVVHPQATPGTALTSGSSRDPWILILTGPILHLGEGLVLYQTGAGPVIASATRALLREHPAPDPATPEGRALLSSYQVRAREILVQQAATIAPRTVFPDDSIYRPGGELVPVVVGPRLPRRKLSRPAAPKETAIEAPFRLQVSPSSAAAWAHATQPVRAADAPLNVELWHSRLAMRTATDQSPDSAPDERRRADRTVRAVWARDRDGDTGWDQPDDHGSLPAALNHNDEPFTASLDRADRHMLVRQTAETWTGSSGKISEVGPSPVGVEQLWLSSLGAWLDLHGAWNTKQYSQQALQSILSWDHVAPMGRDEYVRVAYPGYLFPLGHSATLVKVTERKMKTVSPSIAALYQRMFIVVGERSRTYPLDSTHRAFPYDRVDLRPLLTPSIDKIAAPYQQDHFFWPQVAGADFRWVLDAADRGGRPVRMHTPLLWVSEAFTEFGKVQDEYDGSTRRSIDLAGQSISFVPRAEGNPDLHQTTQRIHLRGTALQGDSIPRMSAAEVQVDAVERVSPVGSLPIRYDADYVTNGLGTGAGQVWARMIDDTSGTPFSAELGTGAAADPTGDLTVMGFGKSGAGSDKAGGFLAPSLPLRGLTRDAGPVGDPDNVAQGHFDVEKFLDGALPKLFGIVSLAELITPVLGTLGLDKAPNLVTETLTRTARLQADLQRAVDAADEAKRRAASAAAAADAVATQAATVLSDLEALLASPSIPAVGPVAAALEALAGAMRSLATQVPTPQTTQLLTSLASEIDAGASFVTGAVADLSKLEDLATTGAFRFEWHPPVNVDAFKFLKINGPADEVLSLRVEGRAAVDGTPSATVTAEIRDIALLLFPDQPLMELPLDHLYFQGGTSGKTEVDAKLGDIKFLGILAFVNTLEELIPSDGFSDPPYVDVDSSGVKAGFTLALPMVAVGVFSLANISLGADVQVPFLGGKLTAGFNFCTREKPFTLTVMCLGGGGWVMLRVAPDGLDVLEVGLEATASLAVDFGVASGSISASVGIYMRLEGDDGSLTGYFRLRGEVDVLGLISASIELYMELVYHFKTGKLIGSATITVSVHVFVFSGSVHIHAERQLAGGNGDPSFRQVLDAIDGRSTNWTDYCDAFAGE